VNDDAATARVIQAESLSWLEAHPAAPASSVVTSLPDVSEVPELGFEAWRDWFTDAARRVMRWVPDDGVSVFFQSDVRHRGVWVDKGYLVLRAADDVGALVLWHKVVCRKPPGTVALGRPSYSHMIAVRRVPARETRPDRTPDVLPDAGLMSWSRAMGLEACRVACRYLRDATDTQIVVDPFCGRGTVLAVAASMGFETLGIDRSAKRCRAARRLSLDAIARDARKRP
jgi:hypothetical protein